MGVKNFLVKDNSVAYVPNCLDESIKYQLLKPHTMRRKIGLEPIVKKDRQGLRTNNVHVQIFATLYHKGLMYLQKRKRGNVFPVRTTKQIDVVLSINQLKFGNAIPNQESPTKKEPDDGFDFKGSRDALNRPPNRNNRFIIYKLMFKGMTRVLPR